MKTTICLGPFKISYMSDNRHHCLLARQLTQGYTLANIFYIYLLKYQDYCSTDQHEHFKTLVQLCKTLDVHISASPITPNNTSVDIVWLYLKDTSL